MQKQPDALDFLPPYIDGKFIPFEKPEHVFLLRNPARPNDILAQTGWTKGYLDPLLKSIQKGMPVFRFCSLQERSRFLEQFILELRKGAEELKSHMMLELSRSRIAVEQEWSLCEQLFDALGPFCAEALTVRQEVSDWEWSYSQSDTS